MTTEEIERTMTFRKAVLILLAGAVFSCSKPQPISQPYPNYLIKEEDWIVYEGTLPSTSGPDVHVELSLFPGAPGLDSRYVITEQPDAGEQPNTFEGWIKSSGQYFVLSSLKGQIIHITDRTFVSGISMRGGIRWPKFSKESLYLKGEGEDTLVYIEENLREKNRDYILIRRSSPLFTVEGYFTVYGDAADYYERKYAQGVVRSTVGGVRRSCQEI